MTEPRDQSRHRLAAAYWLGITACGVVIAWASGRLEPYLVSDSPSYQNYSFASLTEMFRSIRTPGYPAWLTVLTSTLGLRWVPLAQVIVHATATWYFFMELRAWKMPMSRAVAAAAAIGIGCTPMDHIRTISTDALAASFSVITAVSLMGWARRGATVKAAAAPVLFSVVTIFVRPAYLFLIPWMWIAGMLLQRSRGVGWNVAVKTSLILPLLALVPILVWMTLRLALVGEFGLAPFGHQNLGAVLVQLVSDEELNRLGEMGRAVVQQKQAYLDSGGVFAEGEPGATMTIDARWGAMNYFVVIPAAKRVAGDDPIDRHQAIAGLNKQIIFGWPDRYAIWIAKAVRRGAWMIAADIVMHPVFLAAIMVALLVVLARAVFDAGLFLPATPVDEALAALAITAITYLIMKLGFVSMTSPPIGRFSDAAAIFIPPLAAAALVQWCRRRPE